MLLEPLHSHEFKLAITLRGEPNEEGFVCDFRALKRIFGRAVGRELENRNLDELFEFPTSELMVAWIWNKLSLFFPLYRLELREKPHSSVVYYGPEKDARHS